MNCSHTPQGHQNMELKHEQNIKHGTKHQNMEQKHKQNIKT